MPVMPHHLVLGGCGFIGSHVVGQLAAKGYRVTVADRNPFWQPAGLDMPIASTILELGTADWDRLLEDVDVIHHYVWTSTPASANADPGRDLAINVGTTVALLDALRRRGRGRIIFSSSGGTVYGRIRQSPVPEAHPIAPITAYGTGKATAELYLHLYRELHGVDCRIARIANPFGGNQKFLSGVGAIAAFMHHALRREPIIIWGDGSIVRDYLYVGDVAECLVQLSTVESLTDYVFNIGSGVGTSLNDLVKEVELQVGRKLEIIRTDRRSFDVPKSVMSIDRACRALDWRPTTSLRKGIDLTMRSLTAATPALESAENLDRTYPEGAALLAMAG